MIEYYLNITDKIRQSEFVNSFLPPGKSGSHRSLRTADLRLQEPQSHGEACKDKDPRGSGWGGLGWDVRICRFPGDAAVA